MTPSFNLIRRLTISKKNYPDSTIGPSKSKPKNKKYTKTITQPQTIQFKKLKNFKIKLKN